MPFAVKSICLRYIEYCEERSHHHHLYQLVHTYGRLHVVRLQFPLMVADIRFLYHLSEIDMRTSEPTVQDTCQRSLGPSAVR